MEFNLNQILESTILLEGRKEDAIKKYGEEHEKLINAISNADPSGNNKYLDWTVKTALGKLNPDEDILSLDSILRLVNDFHKQLARLKNKDINSYKSVFDLKDVVDEAKAKEEEKRISKQAKKVFENDDVVVYAPFTKEASCKYGAGSRWCISAKGDNYFDSYSQHSNFYFVMNKKMNSSDNPREYKYALQWRFDGQDGGEEMTWWDASDSSSYSTPSWITSDVLSAIKSFDPKHKKIKLGAQLKAFIDNPNAKEYKKYSSILDVEQKKFVINKIISKGDLDSKAFNILSQDLTDEQRMEFITNYVKGQINVSDYKQMKSFLNNEQKIKVLQYNPQILNNYDVAKEINELLTDDQKFTISKLVDPKKINNTDSKVLFKKWSMTPKQREQHNQQSFYVFLSTPKSYIKDLTKVDPLNPESYRTINMMKLQKQLEGMDMYGIKTESGLLDDYIGGKYEDIPSDIIDKINKTSTKI